MKKKLKSRLQKKEINDKWKAKNEERNGWVWTYRSNHIKVKISILKKTPD